MRTLVVIVLLLFPGDLLRAEESGFTLATGVTLAEAPTCIKETKEATRSVRIRRVKQGYEVVVRAFFSCEGSFAQPWLSESVGNGATLVLEKQSKSGIGVSSNCDCLYNVKVYVAKSRLEAEDTLYVVSGQIVVSHVKVP